MHIHPTHNIRLQHAWLTKEGRLGQHDQLAAQLAQRLRLGLEVERTRARVAAEHQAATGLLFPMAMLAVVRAGSPPFATDHLAGTTAPGGL